MQEVKSESEVAPSCPTLSNPMDCSLPGSSVHGIFQARVLEWGAIAFSEKSIYMQPNALGHPPSPHVTVKYPKLLVLNPAFILSFSFTNRSLIFV